MTRTQRGLTDADFDAADRLERSLGIDALEAERRLRLLDVVHGLAEQDRVVEQVRQSLLGPYGALMRLIVLKRRVAKALERVHALDNVRAARFAEILASPGGERVAAVLAARSRLHLDAEAELVAALSPERRRVVDDLRRSR